ncbi:MAG: hypothetical protein ACT4NY_11950 [Pseudonocardiales bacterium]
MAGKRSAEATRSADGRRKRLLVRVGLALVLAVATGVGLQVAIRAKPAALAERAIR